MTALNSLHSALKFTMEKEANQTLPFLDVKIEKDYGQTLFTLFTETLFTENLHLYSLGFIWIIKTQNQSNWNSSTLSIGYLFQKQTSKRTGLYTINLAAKWLPRSDNQFDYFQKNCPFLSTCQRRSANVLFILNYPGLATFRSV